ncbi:restriction endonuclease subunit S [Nocardia fluminea]|uniref:restriction endonuclease subunit S n=1 Tax=Nocardia fluminea TaxID=134984 RepID=UPI003449C5DB
MTDIPAVTLGDLAQLQVGFAFKSAEFSSAPQSPRLLRGDNIGQGTIRWDRAVHWDGEADSRYCLTTGDVVLAMDRPWIESGLKFASVYEEDLPAFLVQRVARLRAKQGINQRYLHYLIASPEFTGHILSVQTGTGIPHISGSQILEFPTAYRSSDEQRAIAEVLGALDDKIAANNRTSGIASDLAASLFQSTIGDPDTTTQTSIRALATEGVLTFGDGYRTKRAEHGQPGMQIVRAGDIRNGLLVLSGDDFVSDDYSDKVGAKICRPGDIVLTTKGTVGRVAIVQDNIRSSVYSPQLCYFRVAKDHGWLQPWLAEWFCSADRVRQTDVAMHKSDMAPYVNLQDVGSLQVPIPAERQHNLVMERLSSLQSLGHVIAQENEVLTTTRNELLPLLMSGKLRVKDAEKKVEAIA